MAARTYFAPSAVRRLLANTIPLLLVLSTASPEAAQADRVYVAGANWFNDTFPANESKNPASRVDWDTTAAYIKTGRNIDPPRLDGLRRDVPGDSLLACACDAGIRLDLVFRIDPGPGNYLLVGNRQSGLRQVPFDDQAQVAPGDGSFWGQYLASPGAFGTPGGHHSGTSWDRNTWNSARMDTAEVNLFPVEARGNLTGLDPCVWSSTYHEAEPKFTVLGVPKFRCFLSNPAGPTNSTNITCSSQIPGWAQQPGSGWDGSPTTREFTKILPDGIFTAGTHIQYFIRRSPLADPGSAVMVPDTTRVLSQAGEGGPDCTPPGLYAPGADAHRWQEFSVLPDLWKAPEYGGSGLACMLVVDLDDNHGDERAWTEISEHIGATQPSKWGAHNGWHGATLDADPDDPAGFVAAHGGQAGTIWDKFDVRGVDDPVNGHAGALGSRLSLRVPGDRIFGKEARIGPTPLMLRTFYRLIYVLAGKYPNFLLGPIGGQITPPLANRTQDDIVLLHDFLTTLGGSAMPRGLLIEGGGFAQGEQSAAMFAPSHLPFMNNLLGLDYRNEYGVVASPSPPCPDVNTTAAIDPMASILGIDSFDSPSCDVLQRSTAPTGLAALEVSFYENAGLNGPYVASILKPEIVGGPVPQPWITLVDGFDLKSVQGRGCARDDVRAQYLYDVLTNVFPFGCLSVSDTAVSSPAAPREPRGEIRPVSQPARGGWARFRLSLPVNARVRVRVLDVAGRLLRTLREEEFAAGTHSVDWDGRADDGSRQPSGVYFVEARFGGQGGRRVTRLVMIQ